MLVHSKQTVTKWNRRGIQHGLPLLWITKLKEAQTKRGGKCRHNTHREILLDHHRNIMYQIMHLLLDRLRLQGDDGILLMPAWRFPAQCDLLTNYKSR